MKLGVCYYPEQWPRRLWAGDAARMRDMGLTWVRIGEFAWSRIEPEPGLYDFAWLDDAVETLAAAGLSIVMGTPTATPPKWLIDGDPDMLAIDADGRPRRFGSRRHYCFSSRTYRAACAKVTTAVAARFGPNPAVQAWQIDNEFGCHATTLSYSGAAAAAFRLWLAERYGTIQALNQAWGGVFWSQEYRNFQEVDPPHLSVTEPNPGHVMDYRRFASDEVVSFNRLQAEIVRRHAPGRPITHNFMGFVTDFDHFDLAADLDFASWDSYPLGFLEQFWFSPEEKSRYLRRGHPDVAAFHHDLYRGCGRGRFWVMEQQPGPVNWARFNPAPAAGMVRSWTWEAFAHGAEVVSYFRWRQAPFAQEQMHAGLNRPDDVEDQGGREARTVASELKTFAALGKPERADVALIFDYPGAWWLEIQPQGQGFSGVRLAFEIYAGLRRLGLDVDIRAPSADLDGYRLVIFPSSPMLDARTLDRLDRSGATLLFGPRTGSRTFEGHVPDGSPPGPLQSRLPFKVSGVESLPPGAAPRVVLGEVSYETRLWREMLETDLAPLARFEDGGAAWIAKGRWSYIGFWPEAPLVDAILERLVMEAGVRGGGLGRRLAEGVRIRRRDGVTFAFNFGPGVQAAPAPLGTGFLLGGAILGPGDVAAWSDP